MKLNQLVRGGYWLLIVILFLLLLTTGCSTTPMFVEVGAGYKLDAFTGQSLQPGNCGGRNPTAHLRLGWEFPNGYEIGTHHYSHWLDGRPFNNNCETYKQELYVSKRWGGR